MKQALIRLLRNTRLLDSVDRFRFHVKRRLSHKNRIQFARENPDVTLPPDEIIYETYGKLDYQKYYFDGRETARDLISLFGDYADLNNIRICEWGCGSARLLRHMKNMLDDGIILVGTDLDAAMIHWNKQHLPGIEFLKNDLFPPLDIDDDSFDIVYSVSVMTHLSADIQELWLQECLRILTPGGHFIFSVHGDAFLDYLSGREKNEYHDNGFVLRGNCDEGSKNQVSYTSPAYVRETLLKDCTIVSFIPGKYREQDFWIVKK